MSEVLALLSSVVYGSADFLGGLASRRASVLLVVVASQGTGLVMVALASAALPPAHPSTADLAWGAIGGVFGLVGIGLLYRALAVGTMSIIAPLTAVWAAAVPLLVGTAVLGERMRTIAVCGVLLALVAIVLVSQSPSPGVGPREGAGPGVDSRSIGLATVAGVVVGFFIVALDRTSAASGLWPLVAARVTSLGLVLPVVIARRKAVPRDRGTWGLIVASGVLDMAANVLFLLAMRLGLLGVVATLTSLYPASTVVLARVVLGERLRRRQAAGVACAIAAVILIVSGRN